MIEETEKRITISFTIIFTIDDPKNFRDHLYKNLLELNVFGRIYVAHEGINAQIMSLNPTLNLKDFLYFIEP